MKYDIARLSKELGGFGKFQIYVFILGCVAVAIPALPNVRYILVSKSLPHRCLVPECESKDDTTFQQNFLNYTTPHSDSSWDECHRYQTIDGDTNLTCSPNNFLNESKDTCQEYIYDRSVLKSTTASEFNLVCDHGYLQTIANSAYMVGQMIGAFFLGDLADRIGRRRGLFVNVSILIIGGILGTFAVNLTMLIFSRFIAGVGSAATAAVTFIMVLEFVPSEYRNFCGNLLWIAFAFAAAAVAPVAYWLQEWRWIQFATTVPAIIILFYYWLIPESIRWSLSQGRMKEARETIKRIEKFNDVKVSQETFNFINSTPAVQSEKEVTESRRLIDLLKYSNLRKRTFKLMFCWAVATLVYYGVSINSAELGGNLYINFVLVMLVEAPSYIFIYLILDRFGRKFSLLICYILGGLPCLISGFLPYTASTAIVALSMVGKFGISAAFAAIYVYTAEVYPTSFRSLGLGVCSTCARVGGTLAPFVADLSKLAKPLPLIIFGILGLAAGVVVLFLPETCGCELPQSIKESEDFGKNQKLLVIPIWENRKEISKELNKRENDEVNYSI